MSEPRSKDSFLPGIESEWSDVFRGDKHIHQLENQILPAYLRKCRWFGGKSRAVLAVKIYQNIPLETRSDYVHFLLLKVRYPDGPTEIYTLPLAFAPESRLNAPSHAVVCRLSNPIKSGYLIDAIYDESFRSTLPLLMKKSISLTGNHYPMQWSPGALLEASNGIPESRVLEADQSNSSMIYGNTFFLKLFRKVEYMINPDYEIVSYLTVQNQFTQLPRYAGSVHVVHPEKPPMLVMMLQELVPNQGDAWNYFTGSVAAFLAKAVEAGFHSRPLPIKPHTLSLNLDQTPTELKSLMGEEVYQKAVLLGQRTAELHLALARESNNPAFQPEPLNDQFKQQLLGNLNYLVDNRFEMLRSNLHRIQGKLHDDAEAMLAGKERVKHFFSKVLERPLHGSRIRIHGDYHLGQVLVSGDDFYILDFEGEPDKPHAERRDKYPALKDVAGMMRSFRYAAYSVIFRNFGHDEVLCEKLMPVADVWYHYVSRYYLGAYLDKAREGQFIPADEKVNDLLQIYSFKKAIYELGYEINNRPDWTIIPLQSLVKFVRHYLDA
jgi:maltose alpha-D-glucosyltransferase/alpha-amylase